MKITIDIPSALITLSAVGIAAVLAGAAPIRATAGDRDVQAVEQVNTPAARDLICLAGYGNQASSLLTVPAGKILVLTGALDSGDPSGSVEIEIDGSIGVGFRMGQWWGGSSAAHDASTLTFATGLPLSAGQTVLVKPSSGNDLLFGYFADA